MEKIKIKSFYFQVDCHFFSDTKIQMMFQDFGYESISIYIYTLSLLYSEGGVLTKKHYKYISQQLKCDLKVVKKIIENYDLFYFEGKEFSSLRVRKIMEGRLKMSEGGKKSRKIK